MSRLVAFLRGINLGNRRVKMDRLRRHFEEMGLEGVESYLASGNVVFEHPGSALTGLERQIEAHLEEALGYEVATLVRPLAELEELTGAEVVAEAGAEGFTPYVIFIREAAGEEEEAGLRSLEDADDRFHVLGREVLWLRRGGISDSPISPRDFEAALGGMDHTRRKLNTVRRILAKFGG